MKTLLVTALALSSLGLVACGSGEVEAAAGASDSTSKTEAPKAQTVSFAITGMTCGACPPRVQSALAKGLGISEDAITIDLDANTASVDLAGAEPDLSGLETAMKETNRFTAELIN